MYESYIFIYVQKLKNTTRFFIENIYSNIGQYQMSGGLNKKSKQLYTTKSHLSTKINSKFGRRKKKSNFV